MGLPSYPNAHDGLVPKLVVSAVLTIMILKNTARSLLGASSSQTEETAIAAAICPEVTDVWRMVSVSRFRALSGGGRTGTERCCVCLCGFEEEEEVSELKCRHYFHKACLKEWFDNLCTVRRRTCPLCRCLL